MKNLQIYNAALKKVKYKLQKAKKTGITLIVAGSLMLSACANEKVIEFTNPVVTPIVTVSEIQNSTVIANQTQNSEIVYGKVELNNIKANEDSINDFIDYINKIETKYQYEEIIDAKSALERFNNQPVIKNINYEYDFLKGSNQIDAEKLFLTVKDNNKDYLKNTTSTLYKKMSDDDMKYICEIIADTLNKTIQENNYIDLKELSANLGSLKILNKNTSSTAFISVDNCLGISENMMNILVKLNKDVDAYRNTIIHEAFHIVQRVSDESEKVNPGKNIGMSYNWKDQNYNPLNFAWFYEASTEKNVSNLTGDRPIVYQTMITYLESISMVTLLDHDVQVNQTEKLDFKKDLNELFKQFGASTNKEKEEIISMMASINIIQMEPTDFTDAYQNKYGITLDKEEYAKVKCTIKATVMETLTKSFYKNLSKNLKENTMTMQDTFYLIKLFEKDIDAHIKYTNPDYSNYNEGFIKFYSNLQAEFFRLLSINSEYSEEEILGKYIEYSAYVLDSNNNQNANFSLNWLEKEKINYYNTQLNRLYTYGTQTIKENFDSNYASLTKGSR